MRSSGALINLWTTLSRNYNLSPFTREHSEKSEKGGGGRGQDRTAARSRTTIAPSPSGASRIRRQWLQRDPPDLAPRAGGLPAQLLLLLLRHQGATPRRGRRRRPARTRLPCAHPQGRRPRRGFLLAIPDGAHRGPLGGGQAAGSRRRRSHIPPRRPPAVPKSRRVQGCAHQLEYEPGLARPGARTPRPAHPRPDACRTRLRRRELHRPLGHPGRRPPRQGPEIVCTILPRMLGTPCAQPSHAQRTQPVSGKKQDNS